MPRFARLSALLVLAVLLLPGVVLAEEKTFEDKNFKLTPSGSWQWMELSSQMKDTGYVAQLGRRAAGSTAMVNIRVVPTGGLSLSELSQEVKDGLSQSLAAVQGTKTTKGKLSGLECDLVLIKGLNNRDSHVLIKAYNLEAGGMFHQVMFSLVDGAETKQAKEVDALRRSYRLLKGAGPEEEAPDDLEGAELGGGSDDDDSGFDDEAGKDGTLTFEGQNLKWTLPEGSPFEWTRVNSDESLEQGTLVRAEAAIEIETDDEEKKMSNEAVVILFVGPQDAGWTPKALMNASNYHANIEENFYQDGKIDYGRMKIIDELPVGNMSGAALQIMGSIKAEVNGKEKNLVRVFRAYAVGLKGRRYVWNVILTGNGMVDNEFKRPLKDLMAGVEFLDTFVWARGPVGIPGIPGHDQDRGRFVDQEKEISSMGFKAKKPKGMAHLSFESAHTGGSLRIAWEKRSEDKTAYLYFDVQSWPKKSTRQVKDFEQVRVQERAGQWMEHTQSAKTVKKGKTPWFKANYGRGKGVGYEFTGYSGDTPFKEMGYVIEYKKHVYWVRYQLGGEKAEKIFSKDLKTLKKAIKFGA